MCNCYYYDRAVHISVAIDMRTLLDRKNFSSSSNGQVAAHRVTGFIIKRFWPNHSGQHKTARFCNAQKYLIGIPVQTRSNTPPQEYVRDTRNVTIHPLWHGGNTTMENDNATVKRLYYLTIKFHRKKLQFEKSKIHHSKGPVSRSPCALLTHIFRLVR